MGMASEIEAALNAHAAWRDRFKDILYGRATFDLAKISAADHCTLGQWLVNEGNRMVPPDLHEEICAVHNEFHRIAGEILQKIKEKRYEEARKDISLDGPLNQTSLRLRSLLVKLSFRKPDKSGISPLDSEPPVNNPENEELPRPAVDSGLLRAE